MLTPLLYGNGEGWADTLPSVVGRGNGTSGWRVLSESISWPCMGGMDRRQKGTGGGILHHTSNWLSCKGSGTGGPDFRYTNNWIKFVQENWVLEEASSISPLTVVPEHCIEKALCGLSPDNPLLPQRVFLLGCQWLRLLLHCPDSSRCKLFHSSVTHLLRLNEIQVFGVKNHQLRPSIFLQVTLYSSH